MASIYNQSPVSSMTYIRREHPIPNGANPKVMEGNMVRQGDTLATVERSDSHELVDVAEALNIPARRVPATLLKREGDLIQMGQDLAVKRILLGLRKKRVVAPIPGLVVRVSNGKVLLEGERSRYDIEATISGRVTMVMPDSHITVETSGAVVQMAWGHGGVLTGTMRVLDNLPGLETDPEQFTIDHRGVIVAIGSPITPEFLEAAIEIQLRGLIGSSMDADLIPQVEELEFPVVVSQGFGHFPMSSRVLELLNNFNGREIILDAETATDWRNKRPEIIIPLGQQQQQSHVIDDIEVDYKIDQNVRLLQAPFLGQIGRVVDLPRDPRRLPGGLRARGAQIELETGQTIFAPFANFEHLG